MTDNAAFPSNFAVSELEKFIATYGEPINFGLPHDALEHSCEKYHFAFFEDVLTKWQTNSETGRRHWPMLAYSINQYVFIRKELKKAPDLSASEVRALLNQITKSARNLASGLSLFHILPNLISDGGAPLASSHLAFLNQLIAEGVAGNPVLAPRDEGKYMFDLDLERQRITNRLRDIETAATRAAESIDSTLLRRSRPLDDPALRTLVKTAGIVWTSLTTRQPSSSPIHSKNKDVPDFVSFVQELVQIAQGPVPTQKQVATAQSTPASPIPA